MREKDRSSHCCSNCINVPKLTDARKGNKDCSFHFAQTASTYLSSLMLVKRIRTVVLTVVRTVSMYLSSLTFAKVHREKATGFGGSYREIIMKKFRIFYQTKLGGLYLMVLL